MIKRLFTFVLLFLVWGVTTSFFNSSSNSEIIQRMLTAIDNLKTSSFYLKSTERLIDENPSNYNYFVKKRKQPLAIYAKVLETGQEVLYDKKKSQHTALVNPNSFPYVNLNLDINGSLMRKGQHHSCADLGFEAFAVILQGSLANKSKNIYEYLSNQGELEYMGRRCVKLVIDFKDYAIVDYKCQKNENIFSIAAKLLVNEYKILMLNPAIDNYHGVKEGQVIKVPNAYGKQFVIYMDKQTGLPIYQKVMDEVGLFELYEFDKIQINPPFTDLDFSPTNKAYGF